MSNIVNTVCYADRLPATNQPMKTWSSNNGLVDWGSPNFNPNYDHDSYQIRKCLDVSFWSTGTNDVLEGLLKVK